MSGLGVTAYEHQALSVGLSAESDISPAEAGVLLQLGRARPGFSTAGNASIRLAQYVGLVNLGGRILEILPKVGADDDAGKCRGTLLRLLRLSHDLPLFTNGLVGHDLRRQDSLELFVAAFLESLAALVRAGLLRRYRSTEDDISTIRGRLNLPRQVAVHAMRPDRLACRFDELTIDNPWNQVLRAALRLVGPWTRRPSLGSLYLELVAAFDDVSIPNDPLKLIENLPVDRQVRHYGTALLWARWILRLLSPNLRAGVSHAPELLFDMNRLFESAIASRLRRRARTRELGVSTQETGRHLSTVDSEDGRPVFRMRPDIVIRSDAKIVSVADTKWTNLKADARGLLVPMDAHVYQLNAYAGAYPAEEVVLIYPWLEQHATARSMPFCLPHIGDRAPKLHVVCVDVGSDDLKARVAGESLLGSLF